MLAAFSLAPSFSIRGSWKKHLGRRIVCCHRETNQNLPVSTDILIECSLKSVKTSESALPVILSLDCFLSVELMSLYWWCKRKCPITAWPFCLLSLVFCPWNLADPLSGGLCVLKPDQTLSFSQTHTHASKQLADSMTVAHNHVSSKNFY